jgi:hypothetical protein
MGRWGGRLARHSAPEAPPSVASGAAIAPRPFLPGILRPSSFQPSRYLGGPQPQGQQMQNVRQDSECGWSSPQSPLQRAGSLNSTLASSSGDCRSSDNDTRLTTATRTSNNYQGDMARGRALKRGGARRMPVCVRRRWAPTNAVFSESASRCAVDIHLKSEIRSKS